MKQSKNKPAVLAWETAITEFWCWMLLRFFSSNLTLTYSHCERLLPTITTHMKIRKKNNIFVSHLNKTSLSIGHSISISLSDVTVFNPFQIFAHPTAPPATSMRPILFSELGLKLLGRLNHQHLKSIC